MLTGHYSARIGTREELSQGRARQPSCLTAFGLAVIFLATGFDYRQLLQQVWSFIANIEVGGWIDFYCDFGSLPEICRGILLELLFSGDALGLVLQPPRCR
jgi:hypothetical protein